MAKEIYKRIDEEEELFRRCLLEYHNIESCRSTGKIDMEYHIDLYLGNGLSVDVKRQKKVYSADDKASEIYTWLEFKNSSGRKGWLYGRASHIAFAMGDHYLMVDRIHLLDYADKVLNANNLITKDGRFVIAEKGRAYEQYKVYSKNGFDRIMMVEVEDLRGLRHLIIHRKNAD